MSLYHPKHHWWSILYILPTESHSPLIELIRYSLSCGIPNPTSFRWNFQVFWWYNYIQNKVIWDPKLTISKWPFWAAKWNTTCLSTLFGLPTPMVVLEPLFLCWFLGVVPFNMWPISSCEENKCCYKLSKCTKWHRKKVSENSCHFVSFSACNNIYFLRSLR